MDSGPLSVERLRELAVTRVEATSLRQVAREVGVTAMGLRYFLDGGEPRPATRRKLEEWFVQQMSNEGGDNSVGEAELAALALLERDVPAGRRAGARSRVVSAFEEIFDTAKLPHPGWLRKARDNIEEEGT